MEEQLISFETASLAHQKGFNKFPCVWEYIEKYKDHSKHLPTQTALTKWLLDNHNIKVTVDSGTLNMAKKWVDWYGYVNTSIIIDHRDGYPTKEQALEVLLKEALKLIK